MAKQEVGMTVLLHPPEMDERIVRRALAIGLLAQGWKTTAPYETTLAAPADEAGNLLASLLRLRQGQAYIPVKILCLDDPERVKELSVLIYKLAPRR